MVFAQKCNTKAGYIDISKAKFLDQSTLKKYTDEDYLSYNDIIINSTGTGTLGRIGIYMESDDAYGIKIVPDSHITIVRAMSSEMNSRYVYYFLKYHQSYFENSGVGSTNQKELKPEVISTFLVAVPPIEEQNNIVSKIDIANNYSFDLDNKKEQLKELISAIKSKILDLAIRGKLVPQDPNDEPASILLERIRAEKEELIKQGKIKRDKKESVIFKGDDNSYYEKIGSDVRCIDDELPFEIPDNWTFIRLENVMEYEQPTPYIVESTDYKDEYNIPVLTAGKSFILGYTNEMYGIKQELPVIIFDDFTTESKYVDFPFKVKSSAMKILTANEKIIDVKYAYYAMQIVECDSYDHKRYWISEFSKKLIPLPSIAEQNVIVKTIENLYSYIEESLI